MKKLLLLAGTALGAYGIYLLFFDDKKKAAPLGTTLLGEKSSVKSPWPVKPIVADEMLQEFSTKFTDLFPSGLRHEAEKVPGAAAVDEIGSDAADKIVRG